MTTSRAALLLGALVAVALVGCTPAQTSPDPTVSASASRSPTASASESPEPTTTPTATPTATPPVKAIAIPDDCRAILSDDVLTQLGDTPLNDPTVGPSGVQSDGSLVCVWRDPRADTSGLVTKIRYADRGPTLDMLQALADEQGFTCFTPDKGTRCEKTWENGVYPVTDGRTLFWRDGVLIDTTYSNLAPSGYTSSIVAYLFD